jgi:L-asparaginase
MMNLRCCGLRIAAVLIVAIGGTALNQAISANQDLRVCHMIATGGTIAMKIDPVKNAPVPALSGEDLVAGVPELAKVAKVRVESLFNIPSDHMTTEHWMAIRKSVLKALSDDEVSGVIISHGTDTLEETAYFLDLTVRSDKPIILVGAQRNASDRDFDGPRNLVNASRICVSETALGKGAMIVLNGQINAAREATKTHTSDVESFKSGGFGFLGVVDHDRVVFTRSPMRRQHVPVTRDALPRVDIVPLYAGADAALFRAAIAAGAKGVVFQAFGWGNINVPLYEAMQEAIAKGIVVVISTRVPNGRVLPIYGFKGGGKTLKEAGAVFADNLSPQKARILLMLALQTTSNAGEIQQLFDR